MIRISVLWQVPEVTNDMNDYGIAMSLLANIYLAFAATLFVYQKKLIFFPPKPDYLSYARWKASEITIPSGADILQAWRVINQDYTSNRTLVYFGGNAEDVSGNLPDAKKYAASVIYFVNLCGYGSSTGKPSQDAFYKNSLDIYDYLVEKERIQPDSIIIMGRSLGSAVAVYLNANRGANGLILVTPFYSIINLAPVAMRLLFPLHIMLKHKFDNIKYIRNINNRVLILAASNDEVISDGSTKLLAQAVSGNSKYVVVKNTNHQTIANDSYYLEINNFINRL